MEQKHEAQMELYIDGKLRTTVTTTNLSYTWNLKGVKRGAHTIQVKAYDAAANVGQATASVNK